jgi:hypothetical protein
MKKDKSVQKIIQRPEADNLPFGMETRIMNRIFLEAEKNKIRAERWGIALVSAVSVSMIAAAFFIFKHFMPVQFHFESFFKPISSETYQVIFFFVYIAFLVLLLLVGDTYLLRFKHKLNSK